MPDKAGRRLSMCNPSTYENPLTDVSQRGQRYCMYARSTIIIASSPKLSICDIQEKFRPAIWEYEKV